MKRTKKSYRFDYYNYNYGVDTLKQTKRERFIYNNISNAVRDNPDCNYFGQFGIAHIGLERFLIVDESGSFQSFSTKLNTNPKSPLKNQVCSIAILYFDYTSMSYGKIIANYHKYKYYTSRKNYLPNIIYKTLRTNTQDDKTYVLNLSKCTTDTCKEALKNFQFVIFNK